MKKYMFLLCLLSLSSLVVACGPRQITPMAQPMATSPTLTAQSNSRGVVDSRYEYSGDKTELNVIIEQSSGEEMTLQVIRRNNTVNVQTLIREGGQISSRYRTTPGEAQLAVKLAANNGWRDVYNDLKERYELAGLL